MSAIETLRAKLEELGAAAGRATGTITAVAIDIPNRILRDVDQLLAAGGLTPEQLAELEAALPDRLNRLDQVIAFLDDLRGCVEPVVATIRNLEASMPRAN